MKSSLGSVAHLLSSGGAFGWAPSTAPSPLRRANSHAFSSCGGMAAAKSVARRSPLLFSELATETEEATETTPLQMEINAAEAERTVDRAE